MTAHDPARAPSLRAARLHPLALLLVLLLGVRGAGGEEPPSVPAAPQAPPSAKGWRELHREAQTHWTERRVEQAERTALQMLPWATAPGSEADQDLAEALDAWGSRLRDALRYAAAERMFRGVLAQRERGPEPRDLAVAVALNSLGHALFLQGRYEEARDVFRRELALRERLHGPEDPELARALGNLAAQHAQLGQVAEARALYERMLRILEAALGPDSEELVMALNGLGMTLLAAGEREAAVPVLERALAIRERASAAAPEDVALAAMNLGSALEELGRYDRARQLFVRALAAFEAAEGAVHPDVAFAALRLGALLLRLGEPLAARPLLERAYAIFLEVLEEDHPFTRSAGSHLADALRAQGDYDSARQVLQRILRSLERRPDPEDLELAEVLADLGALEGQGGDPAQARRCLERALALYERLKGPDSRWVAPMLHNLAMHFHQQGALDQALPLYERAHTLLLRHYGPQHMEVAACLGNMAMLLRSQGDSARAYELLERASAIEEGSSGVPDASRASTINSLAWLSLERGEPGKARQLFERSLALYTKALGPDHPVVGNSTHNLGFFHASQGEDGRAEELFRRAIALQEAALPPGNPELLASRRSLAGVLARTGREQEAATLHRESLRRQVVEMRRGLVGLEGAARLDLVRSDPWTLDQWLQLAPSVGSTGYDEVLLAKGVVVRAEAAERRLMLEGDAHVVATRQDLVEATRRLSVLSGQAPKPSDAAARQRWREEFAAASERCERLSLELQQAVAPYREALARIEVGMPAIQASLGADEALVDMLRSGGRYLAWVVRRQGAVVRVDLGSTRVLDQAVAAYLSALPGDGPARTQAEVALSALLLAPLKRAWGEGVRTAHLVPDAELTTVPFGALPVDDQGRTLADTVTLLHRTMAAPLVPGDARIERGTGALLVGGVDYMAANPAEPDAPAAGRGDRGLRFRPIPDAAAEVAAVAVRLGPPTTTLSGRDATEARLRALAPGRRVVHLATHGLIRKRRDDDLDPAQEAPERWLGASVERRMRGWDPRLLPVLALSGANRPAPTDADDGLLTALEASYLDLRGVELVVLSACSSARGTTASGEGVLSLVQAFHLAGARHVVASLWDVDDLATRLLMEAFYERTSRKEAPMPPADALREASLWLRSWKDERGRQPFLAPKFWAAFVLYVG